MKMKEIHWKDVKPIAVRHSAAGAIVLLFDDEGHVQGASYGKDKQLCECFGHTLGVIMDELSDGAIPVEM